jgi:hypothetical protein
MARLLPILLLLAVGIAFLLAVTRATRGPRSRYTYRPRGKWGADSRQGTAGPGTVHVVHRREIAGLRDAYSSAPLDPDAPLARCGGCQAFYQAPSVASLQRENQGRCVVCGSGDLGPVRLAD